MSLFQLGDFTLRSGERSRWKVECDELTAEDWDALAVMAMERFNLVFRDALGVMRGGLPFERALKPYAVASGPILVVDDVLTTGASLLGMMSGWPGDSIGLVAFARCPVPDGVMALWTLAGGAGGERQ